MGLMASVSSLELLLGYITLCQALLLKGEIHKKKGEESGIVAHSDNPNTQGRRAGRTT